MKNFTSSLLIGLGVLLILGALNNVLTKLPEATRKAEIVPGFMIGWWLGLVVFIALGGLLIFLGLRRMNKKRSGKSGDR